MKGSVGVIVFLVIGLLVVLGMLSYIFFLKPQMGASVPTPSVSQLVPSIPVKDFAPGLPTSEKTTILIQSNDSSEIRYIVPKAQVATYVKSLPPGYHVMSKTP